MAVHINDDAGSHLLSMYMGPRPLVDGGDNLEKAIVDFIDDAQDKLDIAVQELESVPIAEAILRVEPLFAPEHGPRDEASRG